MMRSRIALGALLLLLGAACHPPRNPLAQWSPSPNFNTRRPQMVIIHHTACNSFEEALRVLQTANSGGPVSSHYLIGKDGRLAQLVPDDLRAWHGGGGSSWGTFRDINSISIGIELDNTGFEPFTKPQIDQLLVLLEDLVRRYDIPRSHIIGHADVDPVRKHDPNGAFPWKLLAEKGFGLWPEGDLPEPPADFNPWMALRILGYSMKNPAATLGAFHLHYRGSEAGGLDALDRRILFNLQSRQLGTAGLPHQDLGLPRNEVVR